MKTRSELYRRALELIPGGVNSPVRAMRAIGRDPLFIERGAGSAYRIDGRDVKAEAVRSGDSWWAWFRDLPHTARGELAAG